MWVTFADTVVSVVPSVGVGVGLAVGVCVDVGRVVRATSIVRLACTMTWKSICIKLLGL